MLNLLVLVERMILDNSLNGDKMATNFASAKYQEILDVNTVQNKCTVIGIHTPTSTTPYVKLAGFFTQFRKFKYAGAKVQVIPAATLPADPLQVGFEAGENTIDMRDMLNPILFHGCHGEDMNAAWNSIFKASHNRFSWGSADADDQSFSGADDSIEAYYYAALTDHTWKKYNIQSGFQLPELAPRVWKANTLNPVVPNASQATEGGLSQFGGILNPVHNTGGTQEAGVTTNNFHNRVVSSGTVPLGWLPTRQFNMSSTAAQTAYMSGSLVQLPKIFMGVLVLPPCYLQELYFRVVITHTFLFKEFTCSLDPIVQNLSISDSINESIVTTSTASATSLDISEGAEVSLASDGVY